MRKTRQPGAKRTSAPPVLRPLCGAIALALIGAVGAHAAEATAAATVAPSPPPPPPPPAPLGVFGADMPAAGRFVFSLIPQFAQRTKTLVGTREASSQEVVAATPWFIDPRKPLRGVPQNSYEATQSASLAYGLTKDISLVVTGGLIEKKLDFMTFRGAAGVQTLGMSYTGTHSITDLTAAAVVRLYEDPINRIQFNFGMSFPTGSDRANFTLLQPTGIYLTTRAFYAMQLGTGTFDAMPGVVYAGHLDKWSWGASYRGRFPLAPNPEGYLSGDLHEFNVWGGYTLIPGVTATFRANASIAGQIRGYDPYIQGKAQAANPNFYGGQRVELFGGATISGKIIGLDDLTLAFEGGAPVYQNLNGPQLSKAWQAGAALRYKM